MIFNNYAKYYDLLYKDKDYNQEIEYIDAIIQKKFTSRNLNILDIGCGTGIHAELLSKKGYHVTGIDLSAEMIDIANNKKIPNTEFSLQNATHFKLERKFDVILSLFHVVSYQTTNQQIGDMFLSVSNHLSTGGLFVFDFWYGPAVLSQIPSVRIKRLEDEQAKIFRLAEPDIYLEKNLVKVKYELIIYDKQSQKADFIKESHLMRYLFLPEIDVFLQAGKLMALNYEEWVTANKPSATSWGVTCMAINNVE